MASDLKNRSDHVAKLSIDPVYDKNWCDMPAEIKLECIGKMEISERLSLRCTAKAERSLVDSQRIEFNDFGIWANYKDFGFAIYRENEITLRMRSKEINEAPTFVNYMKKVGVFENLIIYFQGPITNNEQFMTDDGLFTAKRVEFEDGCDIDSMVAVLQKTKNGVESIQNVPYWHVRCYETTDSLRKVAQMWIDKNSKVGSTFQVSAYRDGSFEEYLEDFTYRIVSENEMRVRIRTNNPDRHILLGRGLDEFVTLDYIAQYFRLMVISAEMKESEYDDNCKGWICKMAPDMEESVYDNPDPDALDV